MTKTVTEVRNTSSGTTYASGVSYWPAGPLRHATFGNGTELNQSYNLRYEPRSIASGPVALTYEPTPAGNIGAVTSEAVRTGYGYDMLDRLVAFSPGRTSDARALRYEYAGDRVIAAYTYGPPNTLVYAYGYDDQSNLSAISVYDAAGTTITQTLCLKHDALGRLVLFGRTAPGNGGPDRLACRSEADVTEVIARFEYDARNRRVARYSAAAGTWTEFAFLPDGTHLAELARPSWSGGAWTALRDYVWLEQTPLAQIERTLDGPSGRPHYFHVDHLGLPRALTGPGGVVVWRAEALPYGDIVEQPGATVVTNLRLPGQYDERLFAQAGITGLQGPYYNWNRWYLPSMGRYMELDPIALAGGFNGFYGPNWYGYAEGNPLRYYDDTGLAVPLPVPVPPPVPNIPAPNPVLAAALWGVYFGTYIQKNNPTVNDWFQTAFDFWLGAPEDNTVFSGTGRRKRGNQDPPWSANWQKHNPGKGPNGDCIPCPPDSPPWTATGNHGNACGTHLHKMVYNQLPDCECRPDRVTWDPLRGQWR